MTLDTQTAHTYCGNCKHWRKIAENYGTCKELLETSSAIAVDVVENDDEFVLEDTGALIATFKKFLCSMWVQDNIPF